MGRAHNGVYHGNSAPDSNNWVNVLTFHDNTHTNTVCAQVKTGTAPGYAGTKKCGTGTVNVNNSRAYQTQSGGVHWGGSANAKPFYS